MTVSPTIRLTLISLAAFAALGALVCAGIYILLGPGHQYFGLRNTIYSSRFTPERFARIQVGATRDAAIDLLGEPLQTHTLANYPVWAVSDPATRQHYGTNATIQIESLSFSRSKNEADYDLVNVWIGPDNKVIRRERWVTD